MENINKEIKPLPEQGKIKLRKINNGFGKKPYKYKFQPGKQVEITTPTTFTYHYRPSKVASMMASPAQGCVEKAKERAVLSKNFPSSTFYQLKASVNDDGLKDIPDKEYENLLTTIKTQGIQAAKAVFAQYANKEHYSEGGFVHFAIAKFIIAYCDGFDLASCENIQKGFQKSQEELEILKIAGSIISGEASFPYHFILLFCCCKSWKADTHPQYYHMLETFLSKEVLSAETPETVFNHKMTGFELLIKGGYWPMINWALDHHLLTVSLDENRPITPLHLALHTHKSQLPMDILSALQHPTTINHLCKWLNNYPLHSLRSEQQYQLLASHVHSSVATIKNPTTGRLPLEEYFTYIEDEQNLSPMQKNVQAALVPTQGMPLVFFKILFSENLAEDPNRREITAMCHKNLESEDSKLSVALTTLCTGNKLESLEFEFETMSCMNCTNHITWKMIIDQCSFLIRYKCDGTWKSPDFHFKIITECGIRFENIDFNIRYHWNDIPVPNQQQIKFKQEFEDKVKSYKDQMRKVPSLEKLCIQTVRRCMSPHLTEQRINTLPLPTLVRQSISTNTFKEITEEYLNSFPA